MKLNFNQEVQDERIGKQRTLQTSECDKSVDFTNLSDIGFEKELGKSFSSVKQ